MLSIRVGGKVGGGGGGGARALLSSLRVPPSFCITGLSIAVTWLWHLFHGKVFVALYAIGNLVNRH